MTTHPPFSCAVLRLALIFVLIAGQAIAQTDSEMKALGKSLEKAGKMARQKSLKEGVKACTRNLDSARKRLKKDSKANVAVELKNTQLKLRQIQPLSTAESQTCRNLLNDSLRQVVSFLIRSGGYRTAVQKNGGMQVLTIYTPEGTARVNVPDDLQTGEAGSGSVSADSPVAYAYFVELEDRPVSLDRRPATWAIPAGTTPAKVRLKTRDRMEVLTTQLSIRNGAASNTLEDPQASDLSVEAEPDEPQVDLQIPYLKYHLPSIGWIGGPLVIQGPFDGDSSDTTIRFDGVQSAILAESPRKVIVLPPSDQYGIMTLSIEEAAQKVSCLFRSLWVDTSAPKLFLQPGESTTLTLAVHGLRGLNKPVVVQLDNLTPASAILEGGSHQNIVIAPGDIRKDASFELKRTVTGIQAAAIQILAGIDTSAFQSTCIPR